MKTTTRLAATTSLVAMLTANLAYAGGHTELEQAAIAEGMLTTIALPHDWCGYGEVIAGFKAKYPGIEVNELNPDAGSADEIEAIWEADRKTVVLITNDVDEALVLADRIVVLNPDGTLGREFRVTIPRPRDRAAPLRSRHHRIPQPLKPHETTHPKPPCNRSNVSVSPRQPLTWAQPVMPGLTLWRNM